MTDLLALPPSLAWIAIAACLTAGAVRGFAGFGLSAVAMAILASFIPPIELIPVFWVLEMAASLILMKGGWADADREIALTLGLTAAIGLPIALIANQNLDTVISKPIALGLILALAATQLMRLRIPGLATRTGTITTGLGAGLVTGFSGAGGMFIALYSLARDLPARVMRGTLNIYLLFAGVFGLLTHLAVGTMTTEAVTRGAVLVVPTLAGVFLGRLLFIPRYESAYKPACLTLLIMLAIASLLRFAWEAT